MHIRKVKKFKGFTLIETMAALFIFSMFAAFSILILFNFVSFYSKQIEVENQELNVSQGMIILEKLMKQGDIKVKNGVITIEKGQGEYNCIEFNSFSEKIVVDYYENNFKETSNNVMFKVKNFNILTSKNLVYIFITCSDGRRYRRCFFIKNQSNQDSV